MRWRIASIIVLVIALVTGWSFWRNAAQKRILADGTELRFANVKIGRTNVYTLGPFFSRTLGHFAPKKGISLAGLKLQRPSKLTFTGIQGSEILTAQLRVMPGSPRENSWLSPIHHHHHFRVLISGNDDFRYISSFQGFSKEADGISAFFLQHVFPRDSSEFPLTLQERVRPGSLEWTNIATFQVHNPNAPKLESWTIESSPKLKVTEELELELGELIVRAVDVPSHDIWEYNAWLPVRAFHRGAVVTNWVFQDGKVQDASGNVATFYMPKAISNDWILYWMVPLDPAKIWRFNWNLALDSDFPATNLLTTIVPWPLPATIQTNLGGLPFQIGFVNSDMLSMELLTKTANLRLTFVKAVDDQGKVLDSWSGSWNQHLFWKSLSLSKPTRVHATVAVHQNYPVQFTLLPRYEKRKVAN